MSRAIVALGSNLDNPLDQLQRAAAALATLPRSGVLSASGVYRSTAVGPAGQPDYLNAVLELDTDLGPEALLGALQTIENDQGRVRGERWGPRALDLDLIFYDRIAMSTVTLTLPHPRYSERDFVLYPLREIRDTCQRLPGGANLDTLIARCPDNALQRTQWQLGTIQV